MRSSVHGLSAQGLCVLDHRTRLTEGTVIDCGRILCEDLKLDLDPGRARWSGLLSTDVGLRFGRRAVWLPAWFTTAGRRIPHGVALGAIGALLHFAAGMSLFFVILVATASIGSFLGLPLLSAAAALVAIVLLSILVHEAGHVVAYRILMGAEAPAIAVVKGASCRVIRLRGRPNADALVALAGPIAPIMASAVFLPFWNLAPPLIGFAVLVGIGHVVSVALPFGDGATVREIMRA